MPSICAQHICAQQCPGKCLTTYYLKKKNKKPQFVVLTNFCGIKIPTTGNFKLLMGCHCWWNWEENAHRVLEAGTSKLPRTTRSENGWDHLGPSTRVLALAPGQMSPQVKNKKKL